MPNNLRLKLNLDVDNSNGSFDRQKKDISDSLVQPNLQTDALHFATCRPTHDIDTP